MRLKLAPTIGSVVSLIALASWHIYSRTLRPELRGAWWSHLVTTILGATTVVLVIETVRSATRDSETPGMIQQAQSAGFFPSAGNGGIAQGQFMPQQPHPVAALDDIARTGTRPDYHIRLAPEGFYIWRSNDWHPFSMQELDTITNATVMVQDEGGRERIRSQVISNLQRGGNTIVSEQ